MGTGGKGEIVVAAEVSSDLGKYCDGQIGIGGLGYVILHRLQSINQH